MLRKLEISCGRVGFWFVCAFTFTYGMPRGHSLSIYALFLGKKRTSLYIFREKDDHYYIQTRHNDLFFTLQSFSRKTLRRLARKARVNKERVYRIVHMAPGHPINEYSLNLINSIWPPAVAVKSFIRKSRKNAACWMLVIFFGM